MANTNGMAIIIGHFWQNANGHAWANATGHKLANNNRPFWQILMAINNRPFWQ